MLEAVALGVVGVVRSPATLWRARIEAVAARLESCGVSGPAFRRAALARLGASGERALVSRTLADLQVHLPAALERQLVQTARQALPPAEACPSLRAALRRLGGRLRLAFLDDGEPAVLDADLERLGLGGIVERWLWTARLGLQARAPSPLAFRWLADRLELSPRSCLYVAGSEPMRQAALRAGWQAWSVIEPGAELGAAVDPDVLVDRLEALD